MTPSYPLGAPDVDTLARLLPGYEIVSFIAAGGMGAVYRARHISLDRDVAIKILPRELGGDPEFRRSFQSEARAMAKLNHPNLISVFDCGEVEGLPYIVMEYVHGESLFDSAHGKAVDPDQAADLILKVSAGLAHAHAAGIIHRDIKPANILLTLEAEPKVGDFGLACRIDTAPELCMGTPGYVAPEVVSRPELADRRSDIFAVGMILFELLAGTLPGDGDNRPPSTFSKVDAVMDRIWRKAVHPDPNLRYAELRDFIRDLENWRNKQGRRLAVSAPPSARHGKTPAPARHSKPPRPPAGNLGLRLVIMVVLLGAITVVWNQREKRKREISEALEKTERDRRRNVVAQESPRAGETPKRSPGQGEGFSDGTSTDETPSISTGGHVATKAAPDVNPSSTKGRGESVRNGMTKLANVFPAGSVWTGAWRINDGEVRPITCKVESVHTSEALISMAGVNGTWTCRVGITEEGRPSIETVEVSGVSRYADLKLPGRFELEGGTVEFTGAGELAGGGAGKPETIHCLITRKSDSDSTVEPAGSPGESTGDPLEWKRKATEDFPDLQDPRSTLSQTVKLLRRTKGDAYLQKPDWPYRLAREAAVSLMSESAAGSIPEDARVFQGGFFAVIDERIDWKKAKDWCERAGGRLAVVPDEPTHELIVGMSESRGLWLGATDDNDESSWKWIDGREIRFERYAVNEPNNWKGVEHYLQLRDGLWNDTTLDGPYVRGFVCEWPAPGR
ncbi:MAG: protein kinase [Verrucomicrobiae bacterium]|nr:protein kinase [Verrucomicrobiae bacterium]MCP5548297.1 protein kinase [Akkermansiaceae bacterium]